MIARKRIRVTKSFNIRAFWKKSYIYISIVTISLWLIYSSTIHKVALSDWLATHTAVLNQTHRLKKPPLRREVVDSCRNWVYKEDTVSNSCHKNVVDRTSIKSQMEEITRVFSLLENGRVLIISNAVCLGSTTNSSDISIANQFSVVKLERFLIQVLRWNGPVSSVLYIRHMNELLKFQSFVLEHYEDLRKVSIHIYIDKTRTSNWFMPEKYPYPNNILRNIAQGNVVTKYFLLMDIDLFTTPARTHDSIQALLRGNAELVDKLNKKTLFVLPAFEHPKIIPDNEMTADYWSFPKNKTDVKNMYENGTMPQFKATFVKGQGPTNYKKWISDESHVSYPIDYKFKFEPYVIGAKKSIPRFYDSFRGYGLNKMSWFSELHLAGYKYEVLKDYSVFHANHVASYDEKKKVEQIRQNVECSKGFAYHVVDTYGNVSDDIMKTWKNPYIYG